MTTDQLEILRAVLKAADDYIDWVGNTDDDPSGEIEMGKFNRLVSVVDAAKEAQP